MKTENPDSFVVENAYDLLGLYHETNKQYGFDDSDYVPEYITEKYEAKCNVGAKEFAVADMKKSVKENSFANFSKTRVSVRVYDKKAKEIADDVLEACVVLAQNAPSACNRQATHVHFVKDTKCFAEIEALQLGCKGFGVNASAFAFVTSDLRLYECAEVKLPVFDAGLFTMNLVYAFHSAGICSCVLNASFPADQNDRIKEIAGIPAGEMINGLLVLYSLDEEDVLRVPVSPRRDVNEICHIIR